MISINPNDITILNIKGSDYCCIISLISKNEAINLLKNADLTEKGGTLQNMKIFFSYVKMGEEILTFGDIEIEKNKFCLYTTHILLGIVDIARVLLSNKIFFW